MERQKHTERDRPCLQMKEYQTYGVNLSEPFGP